MWMGWNELKTLNQKSKWSAWAWTFPFFYPQICGFAHVFWPITLPQLHEASCLIKTNNPGAYISSQSCSLPMVSFIALGQIHTNARNAKTQAHFELETIKVVANDIKILEHGHLYCCISISALCEATLHTASINLFRFTGKQIFP